MSPTSQASTSPSLKPSVACQVSNSGYYGESRTNENWYAKFIEYKYTLEYSPDINIEEILKDVELKIINSIVVSTSIFPECSRVGSRFLMEQTHLSSRNMKESNSIIAISSMPPDEATSEECELEEATDESVCTVVAGVLSVFYRAETSRGDSEQEIHNVIEDVLSGQDLISSNTQIKNLRFIGSLNDMPEKDRNSHRRDLVVIISIASSATIILSLGLVFMKWRQHRRNKHDGCSHIKSYSTLSVGKIRKSRIVRNPPEPALMDDDSIMSSEDNRYLERLDNDEDLNSTLEHGHLNCPLDEEYLKCPHVYQNSRHDDGFIRNPQDDKHQDMLQNVGSVGNSQDDGYIRDLQDDKYRVRGDSSRVTASDQYANYLNSFTHPNRTYSQVTWTSAI